MVKRTIGLIAIVIASGCSGSFHESEVRERIEARTGFSDDRVDDMVDEVRRVCGLANAAFNAAVAHLETMGAGPYNDVVTGCPSRFN